MQNYQYKKLTFFNKIYIFTFSLYIIFGNLARFFHLGGFTDNILVTELFLYFMGGIFFLFNINRSIDFISKVKYVYLLLFFSFMYGVLLNGFEFKALLFMLRYMIIIFISLSIGYVMFIKYNKKQIEFLKYILFIFMISLIIGYVIFIVFRSSSAFWAFLAIYGIDFHGDPHVGRFISVYFDPNFYSNIAVLYLLISFYIYYITKQKKYIFFFLIILTSIVLAGSRSGLATLVITLSIVFSIYGFKTRIFRKKQFIYLGLVSILILLIISPILIERIDYILERILRLSSNVEASPRYKNMILSLNIIENNMLFGIGFNYIYIALGNGANWLDSFLLCILAIFGIPIGLSIYSFLIYITILFIYKLRLFLKTIFVLFLVLLLFSSQFNNILVYQFFLLPFLVILSYFNFRERLLCKN